MLVEQLWDAEVTRKAVVTVEAERAYYQSHKEQYLRPEAVQLQTITIAFPATATAEQKQEARKIAEQALVKAKAAKTYDEFGTLAEQLSQDDWRVMMGDHGWVHRGTVTPDLEQALFSLKKGETSAVVETTTGYLILRANDYQPRRQMLFSEMAASIRQRLQTEQRDKRAKEFEQLLRTKGKIEML
jgi:parvulin-like peptidyl-prolyl isomerase